jgi:hypothetical protein
MSRHNPLDATTRASHIPPLCASKLLKHNSKLGAFAIVQERSMLRQLGKM